MLEEKQPQRTPISQLGEFGLIKHLTAHIQLQQPSSLLGVGDDAAIIDPQGAKVVASTDMLVEKVHFDLAYTPLKHLGYKAAVVNFSDIYAMMARPTQLLVSVAVSNRYPVEALEELYAGLYLACSTYGVDLVGGDTTSIAGGMVLSITALGLTESTEPVTRSGAKPTDLLVVSGDLGGAYLGLQVLEREKAVFDANPNMQPDLGGYDYLLERQLKPEARKDIPALLRELGVQPTAMIDISDGLSSECLHLAEQSGVSVQLYEEKIPLDPAVIRTCEEFSLNPTTVALNGGEDYELLFTIPLEDHSKIKHNPNLSIIGHMAEPERGNQLITRAGQAIPLTAQGWNPLSKQP
jgi:thiamine-monophosphate kinase